LERGVPETHRRKHFQIGRHRAVHRISVAAALLGGALLVITSTISMAQNGRAASQSAAQFTAGGTESCLRCHGGESMTVMAETAHGDSSDPHAPYALQGCESCHGPGSWHVSRARGGAGFPALVQFGDRKTRPEQNTACLNCHAKDMGESEGMEWVGSAHDTPRTTCVGCHSLHTTENAMLDKEQQTETCSRCHEEEIANHSRFENKGIVFDKLMCSDCHDVHQLIKEP